MRMPVALGKTVHSLRLLSPYINCPYQGRRPSCRAASHVCRAATPDAPSHGTQPSVVDRPPQISGSAEQSVASTSYDEAEDTFRTMQLILPEPENTKVKTATFIKSSVTTQDCPPEKHPEFAVIGRSNVGKSSLINMLTGRKDLALVSKQPGKTRCINHFLINNSWYLVDLPGYGYARTGKDSRLAFDQFTKSYFLQRNTLATVLLLIDSSIPPQPMDFQYASWLAEQGVPFTLVFTKHDKRKKKVPGKEENITAFKRGLIEQHGFEFLPPSLVTSANTGLGKAELQKYIGSLCLLFQQRQVAAPKNQSSSAANVEYKVPKQLQPN
eukprot:jgi/Chrzof1/3461/Cz12g26130.t1